MAKEHPATPRGSWIWVARIAELTAWGTVALILLILQVADLSDRAYGAGLAIVVSLGVWLGVFFRWLLPRRDTAWWAAGLPAVQAVGFALATYVTLRGSVI